jgi:hypothetical protein
VLVGSAWFGGRAMARAGGLAVRPAVATARVARHAPFASPARARMDEALRALDAAGRREQSRARDAAERSLDAALHRAVASRRLEQLVTKLLVSAEMQAALTRVLEGPVLDRLVSALVEARVVERATAELLAADVPEQIVGQVIDARVIDEVVRQLLADDNVERIVEAFLARSFDSPLYDDLVDRVLESEELWRVVARIARSPEVIEAVTAGSASLAGEMADQVRRRTITADDVAERVARRVLRRPQRKANRALPPGNGGLPPPPE